MKRQNLRKMTLFIALMLFPITIWYFSPAIIFIGMTQHILNGSFFVFLAMFVFSMFFGRAFCAYMCPAGGLQECVMLINDSKAKQKWGNKLKFIIWSVWMIGLVIAFILGKNNVTVNFFFLTDHGISIAQISDFIIYYAVLFILFIPALIFGKRASCHYICWMAPFMIIGSAIGRKLYIPQLHIEADYTKCILCKQCTSVCPMSLNVDKMVKEKHTTYCTECINCGTCIDKCPKKVLHYSFKWRRK